MCGNGDPNPSIEICKPLYRSIQSSIKVIEEIEDLILKGCTLDQSLYWFYIEKYQQNSNPLILELLINLTVQLGDSSDSLAYSLN